MRRRGWDIALARELEAAAARPFSWGEFDCLVFAGDVCRALTGRDPAAGWRGRYRTPGGAVRLLRARHGGDLEAAVTAALGLPMANRLMAKRGDVALVRQDGTPGWPLGLGIVAGSHGVAYPMRPAGLALVALDSPDVLTAWAVD